MENKNWETLAKVVRTPLVRCLTCKYFGRTHGYEGVCGLSAKPTGNLYIVRNMYTTRCCKYEPKGTEEKYNA